MRLLVLDNYDSFTYNLVQILGELGLASDTTVIRNDKFEIQDLSGFDRILISPGPGIPSEAGLMMEVIARYAPEKPILGICLGHQGIAETFGASLYNMDTVLHGISGSVRIVDNDESLFRDLPDEFRIGHYHSWSVLPESINGTLKVTAVDENGIIMGISHNEYNVKGLQFHPESILTENGQKIISNWLNS